MDLDDGYVKMQNGGGLSVVPLTKEDYSELDYQIFKQVNYLLRTEKASDTLYFDKQKGNEI